MTQFNAIFNKRVKLIQKRCEKLPFPTLQLLKFTSRKSLMKTSCSMILRTILQYLSILLTADRIHDYFHTSFRNNR